MNDPSANRKAAGARLVAVDLTDETGAPLGRLSDLDGRTTVGEIASQATIYGMPDDDYALYRVTAGAGGAESVERIPPTTRLSDIETPDGDCLRLRFAPALKGAR